MAATRKTGNYHHGQLRRALLDAALHLAAERGISSFTMREVARRAGVSHAAPYHHFTDKSALVAELVIEHFQALTETLQAAAVAPGTPLDQLQAIGRAYIRFALAHPTAYRLMYRPELRAPTLPDTSDPLRIHTAGRATYQVLLERIVACQQADSIAPGDPHPLALSAWATVHGLATLLLDGSPGGLLDTSTPADPADPADPEHLAALVTHTLVYGLCKR